MTASRRQAVTQYEIARAIKAAQSAGLVVAELVTTRDGVRVVTLPAKASCTPGNPWDRFLVDGAQK